MGSQEAETKRFLEVLRNYFKNLRLEKGLTQVQLAQKGENQHQSAIARLEAGTSPNIGIRILYEVAKGTGTPLWEIIKQAEQGVGVPMERGVDEWELITNQVTLLSPSKRKKFTQLVKDILQQLTDS